jgi:hypothetical protein
LQWVPGGYSVSSVTGQPYYNRGGYHWVPTQQAGVYTTQRSYVPNVVAQQVPQTQMVAKVVTTQVPIQVTRYEDAVETRRIPIQTVRYEEEVHERQIPVTVQKPVVERIVEKVPIRTCKMVEEVIEERIPVTVQRIEYEEREEQVDVKVCKMVTENRILQEPRTVAKWVAVEQTRLTPRTVAMRVPVDGCGQVIESYYYPESRPSTTTRRVIVDPEPRRVESKKTIVEEPKEAEPMVEEKVEPMADPKTEEGDAATGEKQLDDRSKLVPRNGAGTTADPMDTDETGRPRLNGPNEAKRIPVVPQT